MSAGTPSRAPTDPASSPRVLEPIGAGHTRDCFVHPDDARLCIKVPKSSRGFKTCGREARYLARVAHRFPDADLARLPRYRGCVMTDRGLGWVQDRVVDASGDPSPTLRRALHARAVAADPRRWSRALEEFRRWATTQPLLINDLDPANVCVRGSSDGELEFVPIDGHLPRSTWQRWCPTRAMPAARNARELAERGFGDLDTLVRTVERMRESSPGAPRVTRLLRCEGLPSATAAGRFGTRG